MDFVNDQLTLFKHPKTSAETICWCHGWSCFQTACCYSFFLFNVVPPSASSIAAALGTVAAVLLHRWCRIPAAPCLTLPGFGSQPHYFPHPQRSLGHISSTWKLVLDGTINPFRSWGNHHVGTFITSDFCLQLSCSWLLLIKFSFALVYSWCITFGGCSFYWCQKSLNGLLCLSGGC